MRLSVRPFVCLSVCSSGHLVYQRVRKSAILQVVCVFALLCVALLCFCFALLVQLKRFPFQCTACCLGASVLAGEFVLGEGQSAVSVVW